MRGHPNDVPWHRNRTPDVPLTVGERNAVVEWFLAEYPEPVALALAKRPEMTRAALEQEGRDEVHAACLLGLVNAARLFAPDLEWAFRTFAAPHLVAVKELLPHRVRDSRHLGWREVRPIMRTNPEFRRTGGELIPDHRPAQTRTRRYWWRGPKPAPGPRTAGA